MPGPIPQPMPPLAMARGVTPSDTTNASNITIFFMYMSSLCTVKFVVLSPVLKGKDHARTIRMSRYIRQSYENTMFMTKHGGPCGTHERTGKSVELSKRRERCRGWKAGKP
jgi:hypothetical protein